MYSYFHKKDFLLVERKLSLADILDISAISDILKLCILTLPGKISWADIPDISAISDILKTLHIDTLRYNHSPMPLFSLF